MTPYKVTVPAFFTYYIDADNPEEAFDQASDDVWEGVQGGCELHHRDFTIDDKNVGEKVERVNE